MRFCVVGDPIAHSRSPAIFTAAFAAIGAPYTYEARRVDSEGLAAVVDELRRGALDGVNVTLPHKSRALALADEATDAAARVGAANVLFVERRGDARVVVADNTDVAALASELAALGAVADAPALVLGAGGAARAAVAALAHRGAREIVVRARDVERAAALSEVASNVTVEPLVVAATRASPSPVEPRIGCIVQATSDGMMGADDGTVVAAGVAWNAVARSAVAYDVVYVPPLTPFVAAARAAGLRAESGLGMLVGQAAEAFERFIGAAAPLAAMRAAAEQAVRQVPP